MVVASPGTQLLISLLPRLLPYRDVSVLAPTYAEHLASWRSAGATAAEVADLESAARSPCVVLCNPNNPDGRRFQPERLRALADRLAARDGLLIVDEAFADFEPGLSLVPALPHPAILILRSFGKAYGLAGLRLGFALSSTARAAPLRQALGPWAVSGPAAEIGRAAFTDRAWIARQTAELARASERLDAVLSSAGLHVLGGARLFRLAAGERAPCLFDQLGRAGLLVRRFAAHPTWLRFALPPNEPAWSRLEKALRNP
jgi:cobalamin biosynthetic protein CobC